MTVAYQGTAGAFGEEALIARFGEETERVGLTTFADVFAAVADQSARAGVVPIENSLAGSVLENYDLLLAADVEVVGEVSLPVHHCLLARPGARIDEIVRCHSHPQALAQCAPFLAEHGIEPIAAANTAVAARAVAMLDVGDVAAIASARAGSIHGLEVLAADIQARSDNTTRFVVIERERPAELPADKSSLAFATRNEPGALLACLQIFATHGLNLTKLESRPSTSALWEYTFYADVEHPSQDGLSAVKLGAVVDELRARTTMVRVLGRYPRPY